MNKVKWIMIPVFFIIAFNTAAQGDRTVRKDNPPKTEQRYSVEQAMSYKAQLNTIAFSGVAFLTGTFGADTFLPPGKVADYFGFQYMRDIDAAGGGHNMNFLTYIANNVIDILDDEQMSLLKNLAREQAPRFRQLAEMRLPMILAFRMHMEGNYPQGYSGLSREAVLSHTADIFELDGMLSYGRAEAFIAIALALTEEQRASLSELEFGDSSTWPPKRNVLDKRSLPHEENILVMTYASEFFSWYAGSETADIYFCPERHGTYFGGFYMKDYPAMGNPDYFIPTELTGQSGDVFLNRILDDNQKRHLEEIPELQKEWLETILSIRREISQIFRARLTGSPPDYDRIIELSRLYGEMDGSMSWLYADRFASINATLSEKQREDLIILRNQNIFPDGLYYYATPGELREFENLNQFFIKTE
jgi:hypothetical protein